MTGEPSADEVEDAVRQRDDLIDRLDQGDDLALAELFEHATGARAATVKVTLPRLGAPAAGD